MPRLLSKPIISRRRDMQFGLGLPHSGDGVQGASIIEFAQRAEALGFESLWCGDHILLPTAGTDQYPYTADGSFPRDARVSFLETLSVLCYVAAVTERIRLGSTVIILPYRNPIVQAKVFATLDVLSGGRGHLWGWRRLARKGVPEPRRSVRRARAHERRIPPHLPHLVD